MAWEREDGGVMRFMPTMDEFRDFPKFIEYMEQQGAHHCGVAKVGGVDWLGVRESACHCGHYQ